MSKALVINGANFALNKIETVTLSDIIPCTALALSDSSVLFTSIGSTKQLTAIKTPAGATDEITWDTSDVNVATVSDTGLVTCVGCGTATITAYCGNQSATCSISATVVLTLNQDCTLVHGVEAKVQVSGRDYAGITSSAPTRYRSYFADGNPLDGYKAVYVQGSTDYDNKFPIPVPKGATKATLTFSGTTGILGSAYMTLLNADEKATYSSSTNSARAYGDSIGANFGNASSVVFDISERNSNVNGFIIAIWTKTGTDESDITAGFTLTFEHEDAA